MTTEFIIMWVAMMLIGFLIYDSVQRAKYKKQVKEFRSENLERLGFVKTKTGYKKTVTHQDVELIANKVKEVMK